MSGQSLEMFASEIEENVREILGEGYDTYLEDYFTERAETGAGAGEIARKIVNCYHSNGNTPSKICKLVKGLNDFEQIKSRVMFKLIHTKSNEQCLRQIPNISFLDLSIVFYILMDEDSEGMMTAQIRNEHLDLWGVDLQALYKIALQNMQRVMPAEIRSMEEIVNRMGCICGERTDAHESREEAQFYVLSSSSGINGAACLLYPGVIEKFAEQRGKNIIILPSSVHEVLLLENLEELNIRELKNLVKMVNMEDVPREDILSFNVY